MNGARGARRSAAPALNGSERRRREKSAARPLHLACILSTLLAGILLAPAVFGGDAADSSVERELTRLARELRDSGTEVAYNRLSLFAEKHAPDWLGLRASLALGYFDQSKERHERAAALFRKAENDAVLREYATFWEGESLRALGRDAEALDKLEMHRRDFPQSALAEQAVRSLGQSAITIAAPERALAALAGYDKTASRPALAELRAQALERLNRREDAAQHYLALFYAHALSDEARRAAGKIRELRTALGEKFPAVTDAMLKTRAAALYDARQWQAAGTAYAELAAKLTGPELERATLRATLAAVNAGANPSMLASLALSDAEVSAERLYELSQQYRRLKQEPEMLAAIEQVVTQTPQSPWAEEALYAGGNYFWVNLDRPRAASYFRRVVEQFPAGKNALQAHWRVAWTAYLERQPEAVRLMEEHIQKFPGSPLTENFLYWLGRAAERDANVAHARTFYVKAVERFPFTYFGLQAADRLREIGTEGPLNDADVLSQIPAPAPIPALDAPIPASVQDRWERALALRGIALDEFAEAELRAAHAVARLPRLLLEAARAANAAGRYFPSVTAARQAFPQLEARKFTEAPQEIWRLIYPLPYAVSLERYAARAKVDPMLAAGIIRQESIFQRDAVSRAGAVGLMQILPSTGRQLARQLRVGYARARLTEPDYNLRLGTVYLAQMIAKHGSVERALAAYNAGPDRLVLWQAERAYDEPAEFVQSIPFTETREYVQVVLRNAELYRRLYGKHD